MRLRSFARMIVGCVHNGRPIDIAKNVLYANKRDLAYEIRTETVIIQQPGWSSGMILA